MILRNTQISFSMDETIEKGGLVSNATELLVAVSEIVVESMG